MIQEDLLRLTNIIGEIKKLKLFLIDVDERAFIESELFQYSAYKVLENIGEEANKLSDDFIDEYPQIPVHQLRGLRNRLIHDYLDTKPEIVWEIVKKHIPELEKVINEFIEKI